MPMAPALRFLPFRRAACAAFALALGACATTPDALAPAPAAPPPAPEAPPAPAASASADWEVLFDGTSLDAWQGYKQPAVGKGWRVEDGTLHLEAGSGSGDIVTRQSYGDFDLEMEWKIAPCGNSGVFYRAAPGEEEIYHSAPEMQVLDDACHPDARFPSHRAGSNYDLYMGKPGVVKPAGEWNTLRIVARGPHVEHWLNGQEVVAYEQGSPEWQARVAASKFRGMAGYGKRMSGLIGLQDHGDAVWYRNIRVRRL